MLSIAVETFLVRLRQPVTGSSLGAFKRKMASAGGKVELATEKGTFIVSLDDSLVDEFRRMEIVDVIGGIVIRGRYPKKIMVRRGNG